ncbi:U3 small nucleolar RNA-associated protein 4 homolog [Lingula anatina]|uniref:U3 small nucleolar RNA-associated protein 4 homolog n=1 Tax=Lingula anatina TaxID=7574 RepID=A0A1S3KCR9_LINAN|nr:U3 small nucleolar RNA-associated protein 4 homolog [Lingula anatina]|eukprot:XP_013420051.1 U3 small nucleolar RNA-associated protein 4 homolog [Lingula anatina]
MGEFLVHHVRLFDFVPKAIHCLASDEDTQRLALSRSDGSVEIWSVKDNWFQEKIIPGQDDRSVEALVWCQQRLFSGGLQGDITEYDLMQLSHKGTHPSNAGAVWCLVANSKQTHIAAGTEEGCIVIFELTEEGLIYDKALDRQEGRILSLAWHEGGEMMVSGGIDNIRIWSVQSGHAVQRLTLGRQDRNKDTIVWSIAVTQDFTIISGDSRGKTTFWNGKQGTALKSYQSHKADVLSVCASQDGTSVFASGVDPALAQFEYTAAQANSDWKMWVRSSVRNQHTHDVRAVTIAGDSVISGGL